jgi:hypothetical protein
VAEKDGLPDEIRKKLLEKQAEAEEQGHLDEIDLDQVSGGAYVASNNPGVVEPSIAKIRPRGVE